MIFKTFESTDIVAGRTQPVSTGIWSDGTTEWTGFYTSSRQAEQSASLLEPLNGLYYLNVYDTVSTSPDSDIYFSVTYGHYAGSGSSVQDQNTSNGSLLYPTKVIYNQYKNLLLSPGDSKFSFATSSATGVSSTDSDDIFVINFRSTKFKDQLDPGQFEVTLYGVDADNNEQYVTFIDDSRDNPNTKVETGGKRYNIIRGTLENGAKSTRNYEGIGSIYPDLGIIIFNPSALHGLVGTVTIGGVEYTFNDPVSAWNSQFAKMSSVLYESIKIGAAGVGGSSMKARVTEYVPARHFFVRVKNQELNYSNNPSFVITSADNPSTSQDIGKLRFSDFSTDPKVYITSVGLYDEGNNLVAVAKLSQPILKDFANEVLIRIRLDY